MARTAPKAGTTTPKTRTESGRGLAVERRFTTEGTHPYDELEWELRDAVIGDPAKPAFEQRGVEFPKTWTQNATNIVAQKYFRGRQGSPERESSVKQMIDRVAGTISDWGREGGYFATDADADAFEAELTSILVNQKAAFNSPVWFNVGFEKHPQCSACQPHHALVSTPEGMVPIGEIVNNDEVGREVYDTAGTTRIVATKSNGRKPVKRVRLRNGSFIEATPDHVVKAVEQRRAAPQWLRVDHLELGMRLHLHPHRARVDQPTLVAAGDSGAPSIDGSTELETPDEPATVACAQAALAGWLQADGFVGQYAFGTNRSLTIEFQVAGDDEFDWVIKNLDIAFPDVHRHVRDADTLTTPVRRVSLYGEQLRDFVDEWGLAKRGTEIRVPTRLWSATRDEVLTYLRSIFQADGYITVQGDSRSQRGRIAFAVIGESWTEDVQILLASVGIYSRRIRKAERRSNRHDLHEVQISIGSERARFAELIGFVSSEKQRRLLESLSLRGLRTCSDVREEEIVSIEDLGVEEVFDIQTESGEYLSNNIAVHNCFILSVEDTIESILDWNTKEGMIFRGGSGSGINLSNIRASTEQLSKGGLASGPVSFMRGADAWAGTIKSGGKTRRAAKMVVLNVDHPDIEHFVSCKADEEKKAGALRDAGFDMRLDSDAFSSIQYQNANNSVRVSDEFMQAVEDDDDWDLVARNGGQVMETVSARELMGKIAKAAWECADPGVQYDSIINRWHTCPESGRINASNPCSEYMHVDDSACNLASLNLMRFRNEDGSFAIDDFTHTVDIVFLAQEIVVGPSSYPTKEIGVNARAFRQIGIGYANLGALLMSNGLAYDSDDGRALAASVSALLTGRAYRQSAEVAAAIGPYDEYLKNREPHNQVMRMHQSAAYEIPDELVEAPLLHAARESWDEAVALGEQHGYRNAQSSVAAPTGTISFLMDCDTTGIEPDFSLVKFKELVGGGQMKIVNGSVNLALEKLGYSEPEIAQIDAFIGEHNTIIGAPGLKEEHLSVFDVAVGERSISHTGHIDMMAAIQPFFSGALSKTVNLPESATVEDIQDAYVDGWKKGLKALAIYRDGSKTAQALKTDAGEAKDAEVEVVVAAPARKKMPRERESITHKFSIGMQEGYITAGKYEDGTVGEIFLTDIGKEGSTIKGLMNAFATAISIGLQYGVPLEDFVDKFSYMRFEPEGITRNPEIPFAKSLPDYIMRWLASRFADDVDYLESLGIMTDEVRARKDAQLALPTEDTAGPAKSDTLKGAGGNPHPGAGGNGGNGNGHADPATSEVQSKEKAVAEAKAEAAANAEASAQEATSTQAKASEPQPATAALTDTPPVRPAKMRGLELGPACEQCGGMMQRTGSCYTCSSCGNNTGCG